MDMFAMFGIGFLIGAGLVAVLAATFRGNLTWSTAALLLLLMAVLCSQWMIASADSRSWSQYRAMGGKGDRLQ